MDENPVDAKRMLMDEAEAMRQIFVRASIARVIVTKVHVSSNVDTYQRGGRTLASTRNDGRVMLLSPALAELDPDTRGAILAHEFGHAADFLYPGAWSKDGLAAWKARSDDEIELAADEIAEGATGRPISYAGDRMLQTFGPGVRPRPLGLR